MDTELPSVKSLAGTWSVASKPCDTCKSSTAAVFCKIDCAFLCLHCDSRIHAANKLTTRHPRVWLCEVCEQAPASVTCKADAAALCVTCDADIHSANTLASRHERVPVEPFYDSAPGVVKASAFNLLIPPATDDSGACGYGGACQREDLDAGSWLIPNLNNIIDSKICLDNITVPTVASTMKHVAMIFPEMDTFFDFGYTSSFHQNHHQTAGTDSVVPVQTKPAATIPMISNENCFEIDFSRSNISSFNYPSQSFSQSVSSSSVDVGVVPDGNSPPEISFCFGRNNIGTDLTGVVVQPTNQATQLCGVDREARVLRYKEKRKNRKFEKTIRYASRKAYAESRPRIKGRFAKRTDLETEMDQMYNDSVPDAPTFFMDSQYGVVPSF